MSPPNAESESNSPWHDTILTGRVKTTIVGGRVVFDRNRIL